MSARFDYLSNEWIAAVAKGIAANETIRTLAKQNTVAVTQVVTGTPRGDITYHLESRDGKISFASGPAKVSDIAFTQDWGTAVGVATGKINAQEAFISGKIRFKGDHQRVIDTQPLFLALDEVFSAVNADTNF
ncbi:MAG: SCP2 sterol-binding domain-containing protein [Actinobacteria bacterium]|nr:SCP2 sterol-binding domain-containing protein [Actinomycetota bacterium]